MRSGPFARLMAWTLRFFPICLFLLLCSPAYSSPFSSEINMLRDEMSRLRAFLPGLGYPDPTPSELEELAKKSPSKARIALKEARTKYVKEARVPTQERNSLNWQCNRWLANELRKLWSPPTVVGRTRDNVPRSEKTGLSASFLREHRVALWQRAHRARMSMTIVTKSFLILPGSSKRIWLKVEPREVLVVALLAQKQ